ncbi:MAG: GNAT family N-acetyltransferase [Chloroflexi bacterium]|nr:GNAT family N-acetyltransferase [Chloroflexota bacterium]
MELYDERYCQDLGDGYMVRWATPADIPGYVELCMRVFRSSANDPLSKAMYLHGNEQTSEYHPQSHWRNLAVVVDANDQVVAGAILMHQPMDYAGIHITLGRPESVASAEHVRNRGFVRHIFQLLHAKSEARGDHLQGITGIPYFYRKFGYDYGIDAEAYANVPFASLPAKPTLEVSIRRATVDQYATFVRLYDADRLSGRHMITTPIEHSYFTFLVDKSTSYNVLTPFLIYQDERVIGYLILGRSNWDTNMIIWAWGLAPTCAWHQYALPVLHALPQIRDQIAIRNPHKVSELTGVIIMLDEGHAARQQLTFGIPHTSEPVYAWYTRVADYAYILESLRPVLERRLSHSSMCGFSGDVHLSFYGKGVSMSWQAGQLVACKNTRPPLMGEGTNGAYPPGAFMLQIFGRKSFRQIKAWHHEVWADATTEQLLGILFPTQPSWFLHLN